MREIIRAFYYLVHFDLHNPSFLPPLQNCSTAYWIDLIVSCLFGIPKGLYGCFSCAGWFKIADSRSVLTFKGTLRPECRPGWLELEFWAGGIVIWGVFKQRSFWSEVAVWLVSYYRQNNCNTFHLWSSAGERDRQDFLLVGAFWSAQSQFSSSSSELFDGLLNWSDCFMSFRNKKGFYGCFSCARWFKINDSCSILTFKGTLRPECRRGWFECEFWAGGIVIWGVFK